jgi:hypothetical protein
MNRSSVFSSDDGKKRFRHPPLFATELGGNHARRATAIETFE